MDINQGLKPGLTLRHGAYRIEKILGQGGFGITYLAMDLNLDRYVAIKEFFPKDYCDRDDTTSHVTLGTQGSKDFVNRLKGKFLKEARNIAKFDNPYIVRIHSAFEENNTAYYVMDYVEGDTLADIVKAEGPIPEDKALLYIKKVGNALDYVHTRNMTHLDVKPANIIVRKEDGTPILIDFGLAKQYDAQGQQTSTTPTGISHGYAPMEQYNAGGVKDFSPQTDLYSLAATLYFALSGTVPLQATRRNDEDLTFPALIPTRLIGPIEKAMSPGRKNRHQSISSFLHDLDASEEESGDTVIDNPEEMTDTRREITSNLNPPDETNVSNTPSNNSKSKISQWIWIAAVAVVAVVIGIILYNLNHREPEIIDPPAPTTITDLSWESPLGIAAYSGEIVYDTLANGDVRPVPHGKGTAKIIDGKYKGAIYDGRFVNGIMEGETVYTLSNGDDFKGTFHANEYEKGRYTSKEGGLYFEGTYKDMKPYKGIWKDSSGRIIQNVN